MTTRVWILFVFNYFPNLPFQFAGACQKSAILIFRWPDNCHGKRHGKFSQDCRCQGFYTIPLAKRARRKTFFNALIKLIFREENVKNFFYSIGVKWV